MAEWRLRARALGLRDVLVWVPDGDQAELRAVAQRMRHKAGIHMGGEDEVEERIGSVLEALPETTALHVLLKVLDRVRARSLSEACITSLEQRYTVVVETGDAR